MENNIAPKKCLVFSHRKNPIRYEEQNNYNLHSRLIPDRELPNLSKTKEDSEWKFFEFAKMKRTFNKRLDGRFLVGDSATNFVSVVSLTQVRLVADSFDYEKDISFLGRFRKLVARRFKK